MNATTAPNWVSYITAIGSIVTPLLVLGLTGLGWRIKSKLESDRQRELKELDRIKELEDKLRSDRIQIYNDLLEPFFVFFTPDEVFSRDPKFKGKSKVDQSIGKMLTVEYRKVGFKLALLADDDVLRSYNALMQFLFHDSNDFSPAKTSKWVKLLGDLLLCIRKSMGNQNSQASSWEMMAWFMTDIAEMEKLYTNSKVGVRQSLNT